MGNKCGHTCNYGKRAMELNPLQNQNEVFAMQRATTLCFAILAVKMCMSKRFNKAPQSPEEMKLKSLWIEGVDKIKDTSGIPKGFNPSKETDVIVHGYLVNSYLPLLQTLAQRLKKKNHNVLLIDWELGAHRNYAQAAANTQTVGAFVYQVLKKNKIPWKKVHILGQGLGAHVAAETGKLSKAKIGRITGLDPAGPLFEASSFGINKGSAQFVDVIHTDSRPNGYGIRKPCGHMDVYVNGGRRQPGCTYNPKSPVNIHDLKKATIYKACGHLKAIGYYIETIKDSCKLRACECTYKRFLASKCSRDKCVFWGDDATKTAAGAYYGVTATSFPYCRTNGTE
ncbi:pancreatic triacylglycerol lipase-like [Saccostrea echinata]|uniref:pancreatic triacylglycerol lipase-like n=1 Tax=Saccostrea echinata TaxID=191078 RepID=UPI002A805630|nr:pancreatic triacylglycerol lipase-like [Saccostrea echinata]